MKGSVKVTSQHFPEQTITLKPHHKAYVKDGQLAVTKVNDFTPYRWKEGLICFKDEPFQTIMEDFENIMASGSSSITKGIEIFL